MGHYLHLTLPFIYQDVMNLILSSHHEKSNCIYECCNVGILYSCLIRIFDVAKFTILIPLPLN